MLNKWVHLAIRFWFNDATKKTATRIYWNQYFGSGSSQGTNIVLLDSEAYVHLVGAEINSYAGAPAIENFFKGYIYNFCSSHESQTSFKHKWAIHIGNRQPGNVLHSCARNENTCGWDALLDDPGAPLSSSAECYCPQNMDTEAVEAKTEICVSNCLPNEYIDEENGDACLPCAAHCETCMNGVNCNHCHDQLCLNCDRFGPDAICSECIENAVFNSSGVCECLPGLTFIPEDVVCFTCTEECETCTDKTNLGCLTCAEGYYILPGTHICNPYCPTGFVANDITRTCDNDPGLVFCVQFRHLQTDWTAEDFDVGNELIALEVISGEKAGPDDFDPLPIYRRGLWFGGAQYSTIYNLVFNVSYTFKMWIRPSSSGNLFSINTNIHNRNRAEDFQKWFVSSVTDQFGGTYSDGPIFINTSVVTATTAIHQEWIHVASRAKYDTLARQTTVEQYLRTESSGIATFDGAIIDDVTYRKLIAVEKETTFTGEYVLDFFYGGFIYSICLTSTGDYDPIDDIDLEPPCDVASNYCTQCPKYPEEYCLIDCEYDEFIDDQGRCFPCETDCTEGCVRFENCVPCVDPA